MQHYQIEISPAAKAQINETVKHIYQDSPQNAEMWLTNVYKKISSLETMHHRSGLIREIEAFKIEVRERRTDF